MLERGDRKEPPLAGMMFLDRESHILLGVGTEFPI